nr:type II toxin-antitoxin system RelE/ParE family toxin [Mesorhizobium sp. CO1-1-8]
MTLFGKRVPNFRMRHRITHRAERDLKDIYRHTFENFGHTQAEKYLRELDAVLSCSAITRIWAGSMKAGPISSSMASISSSIVWVWRRSLSAAFFTALSGDLHHNDIDTDAPT